MAVCTNTKDPCPGQQQGNGSARPWGPLLQRQSKTQGDSAAFTLKKPMTVTSLDSTKASAAAPSGNVVAAGPVRFFSQFTMSSASLPAAPKHTHDRSDVVRSGVSEQVTGHRGSSGVRAWPGLAGPLLSCTQAKLNCPHLGTALYSEQNPYQLGILRG